ncbi:hypothetical protein OAZ21_02330 [Bacteroidota bacterium]|nr:hypothetical protein [Bacteroidota bacterium]
MKKIYTTLIASLLLVTNYATDIYVNNSGQPGTYTTIAAAISAASSGDRIFISPYGVYTENLTVDKSITFASAVSGTNFNVLGSFSVTANAGMDVRIIGGIFSNTLYATTNTATQNNMTDIYVIDSKFSSINLSANFVRAHILFCSDLGSVSIQNGDIIGCSLNATTHGSIYVYDGPNNATGDTVKIIGNVITGDLDYYSDDNYFVIANNSIGINKEDIQQITGNGTVFLSVNAYSTLVNNLFLNNIVVDDASNTSYGTVELGNTSNWSNLLIRNNVVINTSSATYASSSYAAFRHSSSTSSNYPSLSYNFIVGHVTGFDQTQNSVFSNIDAPTSAAHDFWNNINSYIDSQGRCSDVNHCINKGIPSIECYDIDMTINDRGTYGGPYSIDNYINNTSGKARIYDLDIPFEIWSGQTPTVKAKGAHTK